MKIQGTINWQFWWSRSCKFTSSELKVPPLTKPSKMKSYHIRYWKKELSFCKIMSDKRAILFLKLWLKNDYQVRLCQKIPAKFWQKNGYLARIGQHFCKNMDILVRFLQILPESCEKNFHSRIGQLLKDQYPSVKMKTSWQNDWKTIFSSSSLNKLLFAW